MRAGTQVLVFLEMSLGNIRARLSSVLVVIVGIACVVGVLISMLSMGASFRSMATRGTRPDRLIVTAAGDQGGAITRDKALALSDLQGVKRDGDGKPLASGVLFGFAEGRKRTDGVHVMYGVRGVKPNFFAIVPELRLTDGRMFQSGLHEVIVGTARRTATMGLELGDRIRMRGEDWLVVGHYTGVAYIDDGAMADADTLMAALKANTFESVAVLLNSSRDLEKFKGAVKANSTLSVNVEAEDKFLARETRQFTSLLDFISYFIASIMGIGATVGTVNIMYMMVDQRRREMATLRAIGFGPFPLILAVLLESLLIALPGALLGATVAWALFNGHHVTPVGFTIDLTVTAGVIAVGVGWALSMGLIGGLFPALRTARVPIAEALRAV
ncbi:MAG TPA: ABC transporter permease [Steroidobacteraceae bacterium]|nr:ABC transporter permease [Steroidobacteraceae bacterium]